MEKKIKENEDNSKENNGEWEEIPCSGMRK